MEFFYLTIFFVFVGKSQVFTFTSADCGLVFLKHTLILTFRPNLYTRKSQEIVCKIFLELGSNSINHTCQSVFTYSQAQPQCQLSLAELALVSIPPASLPSGLVVNKQKISSTCFVTFVGLIQSSSKHFLKL